MPSAAVPVDEASELVARATDFKHRFPSAKLCHLDNLPGARVYVRDSDWIAHVLGRQPLKVLDWGCGYGQMAWLLANRGPYAVTAADFPGSYQHSGLLKHPGVTWLSLTDPVKIDVPSGTFDAVVSSGTLEHVQNIHASMTELCRILRPGAYLFVFRFPNEWSYIERFARSWETWHHAIHMTPHELRFLMKMHCLEVLEIGYDSILPVNCMTQRLRWLRPFRRRYDSVFTRLDQILVRLPIISRWSTSIRLLARKSDDYTTLVPASHGVRE